MSIDFRKLLYSSYRFAVAVFVFFLIFDFIFSPVWLHGYVWSLNQNYTRSDYAEEAEGQLLEYQMKLFPQWLRFASYSAAVLFIVISLRALNSELRIWALFRLSVIIGLLITLIRAQQEGQRLMPLMHLGFYSYLNFFVVGFIWTVTRW